MTCLKKSILQNPSRTVKAILKKGITLLSLIVLPFTDSHAAGIGHWSTDTEGLPCFNYTGALPATAKMPNGEPAKMPDDPWFIIGNYQLTVFPHVSGEYELISGQRSWARLNHGDKPNSGSNFARIRIISDNSQHTTDIELSGTNSLAANPALCKRTFGCGYAQYAYSTDNMHITRRLSTTPSTAYNNGTPALLIEVRLTNTGSKPLKLSYEEGIKANYRQIQYQRSGSSPVPFTTGIAISDTIPCITATFAPQVSDPLIITPENQISVYDIYPPVLFLYDASRSRLYSDSHSNLCAQKELTLKPNETKQLRFVVGFNFDNTIDSDAKSLLSSSHAGKQWKSVLPEFESETDPTLRNEMIWNAYVLEAMATYSRIYGETKIPQGTIYDYDWGQHASARDNFQHALPLIYYNPSLAKSVMRYMAQRTTPYGDIRLIETGSGWAETLPYCTSDQQLFFFLLLKEYLRVTKDYSFLDEQVDCFPKGSGATLSMLNVTINCFRYLKDVISRGPHGLIRLLNSDWNDNVFVLNKVIYNEVIYSAESHMNSAMAIVIFDDLAASLRTYSANALTDGSAKAATSLAQSMDRYHNEILTAFMTDLGNRDFSRRMYFDGIPIGEDNMYVEPMGYMLQMTDLNHKRKKALYQAMCNRIYSNEKLGARQQQTPDKEGPGLEKGSRENGGMWYSMNGPIIAGLASFDPQEAMKRLRQLSFANYAKQFPQYWTSYWSASDNIESSLMPSEGLADQSLEYHTIPVFCAHPHAWLLYCYYLINEKTENLR